jgi:Sec-independent protein translocase protein TatA
MGDVLVVLIIVLILVIVWRGPKTLPGIGAAFGRGVKEARSEASKIRDGDTPPTDDRPA